MPREAAKSEKAGRGTPRFYLPFPQQAPSGQAARVGETPEPQRLWGGNPQTQATVPGEGRPHPPHGGATGAEATNHVMLATSNTENLGFSFLFCFGTRGPLPKMFAAFNFTLQAPP